MMPLIPDVSVVEVEQESTIMEEKADVEILTDAVETVSLSVETEQTALIEVGIQGPPGPAGSGGDTAVYAQRVDVLSDEVIYRGEAAPGASDFDPVWRVRRMTVSMDGGISIATAWANGSDDFVHPWSARSTFTY